MRNPSISQNDIVSQKWQNINDKVITEVLWLLITQLVYTPNCIDAWVLPH